jgi:hypothetical protein
MRYPFTLYKVTSKSGTVWHARFWDDALRKYAYSRSTGIFAEGKKERRREAGEAAKALLAERTAASATTPSLAVAEITHPVSPIQMPVSESQATKSIAKAAVPAGNKAANTPLIQYLCDFWTPDSEYAKFKRDVKKKPLSAYYLAMNHDDVRRHIAPFPGFQGLTVGGLTKAILKKWMIWLAGRNGVRYKKGGIVVECGTISGRRANAVIQSVRVAIRWAVDNEEIPADPFHKVGEVAEAMKEKGILTLKNETGLSLPRSPITGPALSCF